ncbi:transcriptional regulator, TetR family [Saccharopolyspora kobensis]|uniref:Transcriptional regulator, TetR family n=1 Tax=Saccharopolyspora kobensis TaxID=146035 RepID=A0A1H6E5F3_9PSEU|nr:TetR/AcrR family transcriptional regulator [Saccharopolyspora kobensis]SEG92857.1 transcriptional regulator, TetR family [Saccharopolyspora kobensis]SFD40799.1 transcriptional regulator, TetR family [Saccharopolyspora kobensis]
MCEQDRRTRIADAAIELVAEHGVRALTHLAVDARLELPRGSTSYYMRTRRALLEAAVARLAVRARADFDAFGGSAPPPDVRAAADRIATHLDRMLGERRSDTIARYALVAEVNASVDLHEPLARAAFSRQLAVGLMAALQAPDPEAAGADLVSLCEGLVFDRIIGSRSLDAPEPGSAASRAQLSRAVEAFLRGVLA